MCNNTIPNIKKRSNILRGSIWQEKSLKNGEYNFFVSKDFSYGLLGHPWRKEIYVFGDVLINKFENQKDILNIC